MSVRVRARDQASRTPWTLKPWNPIESKTHGSLLNQALATETMKPYSCFRKRQGRRNHESLLSFGCREVGLIEFVCVCVWMGAGVDGQGSYEFFKKNKGLRLISLQGLLQQRGHCCSRSRPSLASTPCRTVSHVRHCCSRSRHGCLTGPSRTRTSCRSPSLRSVFRTVSRV